MKYITYLILSLLLITSCNKEDLNNDEYLIFGHFHGECMGATCVETYKLTSSELYVDETDSYDKSNMSFDELKKSDYKKVKDLMKEFPKELWEEDEIIGCPDCLDQGGYYIAYKKDGIVYKWLIDKDQSKQPSYLIPFIEKVEESLTTLNY